MDKLFSLVDRVFDFISGKNLPDWLTTERDWREMLMYVAHPTRLKEKGAEMEEFVHQLGFGPVNPFGCGQYKYFEGGIVGRSRTLEFGLEIQKLCGSTGVLGISEGVMGEVRDRLEWDKERRIRVFHDADFDPMWDSEYERLKADSRYGDVFAELRGKNQLIVFVGPSAVGKTYWIERLIKECGARIECVKNVTTRKPRAVKDEKYYHVVAKEQFEVGVKNGGFLEHTRYLDNCYGSSLEEVKRVLKNSHGIFALTPEGALQWYKRRFEINIHFILLKPVNELVLLNNFGRRGERDQLKIATSLKKSADFTLPDYVPHRTIPVTSVEGDIEELMFGAVSSILKK